MTRHSDTDTLPATGTPLAVVTDVALCDRREHELAIVTDGQRAYVYPIDSRSPVHEDTIVQRTGVTLTARCPLAGGPSHDADPDQCDGTLTWRMDAEGVWGADADALRLLTAYGFGVEQ